MRLHDAVPTRRRRRAGAARGSAALSLVGFALTFASVHLDAFRLSPGPYVTALKWRILGKRVRARGQLAPLLARSPKAYQLWTLSRPSRAVDIRSEPAPGIIALVCTRENPGEVEATLASLEAEGVQAHVIGAVQEEQLGSLCQAVSANANSWIMPIFAGDTLATDAAAKYSRQIARIDADVTVIYADDDRLDRWGRRVYPHFKPDWNCELQRHHDFLTGACIVRAEPADLDAAARHMDWPRALVERAARRGSVTHIPAVLHHRRTRPVAALSPRPAQLADHLPRVSVIIPTRNRVNLLRTCIAGLRATHYPDLEVIVANNDSDEPETLAYLNALAAERVRVLDQPGPFNYSTINNAAVAVASGELICLLNNDIEVLAPDWLAVMATQALRPEVGAVGAQLLYPDGRIQHAGVVIGVGNAAGHAHRFLRPEAEGYFRRHALPQFISAVTGACLVVRKDKFLAVGGLDEENFAVAFNDVDLCLKLNQRGWQSFYEPRAVLVHHESVSRGFDTDPVGAARFAKELAALQRIWRTNEIVDPYHHPMLSRASEQFALDLTSMVWG